MKRARSGPRPPSSSSSSSSSDESSKNEGDDVSESVDDREMGPRGIDPDVLHRRHLKSNQSETEAVYAEASSMISLHNQQKKSRTGALTMEVAALLNEIRVPNSTRQRILKSMPILQQALNKARSRQCSSKSLALPVLNELPKNIVFDYHPPEGLHLIGSFLLETCLKQDLNVDVALEFPQKCFQPSDLIDGSYKAKRLLYLGAVAEILKKTSPFGHPQWEAFRGDYEKLCLVVPLPLKKEKIEARIRIHVSLPSDSFKVHKLRPARPAPSQTESDVNSVKYYRHYMNAISCKLVLAAGFMFTVSSIIEDMMMVSHLEHLNAFFHANPLMRDAILLLKVWLRQRDLTSKHYGSLNGFVLSMLLSHFVAQGKISPHLPAHHIVAQVLHFLSTAPQEWPTTGFALPVNYLHASSLNYSLRDSDRELFKQAAAFVFMDDSNALNIAQRVTESALFHIAYEAKIGLAYLEMHGGLGLTPALSRPEFDLLVGPAVYREEAFSALFVWRADPVAKFDCFVHLTAVESADDATLLADWTRVESVIRSALSQRILLVTSLFTPSVPLALNEAPSSPLRTLTLGLILHPQRAASLVEHGPRANDKEAARAFRAVWGSKAEKVRRFRDGSIEMCVVWPDSAPEKRFSIIEAAARYLSLRHAPHVASVSITLSQLDHLLVPKRTSDGEGANESAEGAVLTAWEKFVSLIQGLSDALPLRVKTVEGVSSVFSYSAVNPPRPHSALGAGDAGAPLVDPINCILQFQSSGQWPMRIRALARVKTALYLAMAKTLRGRHEVLARATRNFLDVPFEGFVFRITIFVPLEIQLLSQPMLADSAHAALQARIAEREDAEQTGVVVESPDTPFSVQFLPQYRELVAQRGLRSMLHALHTRYPAFGPTARLTKLWFQAHLAGSHVTDEFLELLVAAVFTTSPQLPCRPPTHALAGFVRVLRLLSTFDWANEPLCVDFLGDFKADTYRKVRRNFEEWRMRLTAESGAVYIVYSRNTNTSIWTLTSPHPVIFQRFINLAGICLKLIGAGLTSPSFNWEQIFEPAWHEFDAVVELAPLYCLRANIYQNVSKFTMTQQKKFGCTVGSGFKNEKREPLDAVVVGFDPVERYAHDLQTRLNGAALVLYDASGRWSPTKVALLLNRSRLNVVPPQPERLTDCRWVTDNGQNGVAVDPKQILHDARTIGGDLVEKLHANL